MTKSLRLVLVIAAVIAAGAWAVTFFGPPGLVPRMFGTGGFVPRAVNDVPHPFTFDRPRFWDDSTDELHRYGERWDVLVQGPQTDVGVTFAALHIDIRPDASLTAEYPVPGGPYLSLDDFIDRHLPSGRIVTGQGEILTGGRPARDLSYDYVFYRGPEDAPAASVNCRGRAVFFEDRGYYYMIAYRTRDVEYDRYAEVFDRAAKSFKFLD